jgi:ABC-2 type transport system permease protein
MRGIISSLKLSRLAALLIKEFRQIARNRLLLYLLLVPPILQLLILAASLDPELHHLSLGVCDRSASQASRRFQEAFRQAGVFNIVEPTDSESKLLKLLAEGKISVLVLIPADFLQQLAGAGPAQVQTLVDGSDAYTAGIAGVYLRQVIGHFKSTPLTESAPLKIQTRIFYNPGLKSSWYIVPGILGSVLTLVGTLVSSAVLLRERESGTLEQLLMTPARSWEIILAKIAPLFLLLMCDVVLALLLSSLIFGMPARGNMAVFLLGTGLYVCTCIGSGLLLGTFCSSQRQAQLSSFFLNIPLIQLSGAVVPFESMPDFLQRLAALDPLRHFSVFARASLLKGASFDLLCPQILILFFYACLLLSISVARFRSQQD